MAGISRPLNFRPCADNMSQFTPTSCLHSDDAVKISPMVPWVSSHVEGISKGQSSTP